MPLGDVMEIDEICIRQSPSLWLWIAVSRVIGHVLGFALGERSDAMLSWLWEDIPDDYCGVRICTDGLAAYQRFFEGTEHEVCDKGSGKTSIVEAMNTHYGRRGRRM